MARTSQTVTEQEVQAYVKFCKDNNIVNYDGKGPETLANADFVLNYFLEIWKQDMNEANFAQAFPQLKPHLKFYSSPQHAEYTHIANQNMRAAQQLMDWLATQGKTGQLVNAPGDERYENLALILTELRNRREDVSPTTIRAAEDRIAHRPGRKLHYVQAPRRTEPQSAAAKSDDGTPFLGRNLNEPEWVRRSRERSAREAKEAASQRSSTSATSAAVREAQRQAEELRGNSHAESDQLNKIFVTVGTEIDWVQTLAARQHMQKQFNKQQAVRRFTR